MIIYNVTTHIAESIHRDWLKWMKETHMQAVMQTGCFSKFQLVRLIEVDETEGPTYAAQYYAESKEDYNRYAEVHVQTFRKAGINMWGDKMISFSSLMEIVH